MSEAIAQAFQAFGEKRYTEAKDIIRQEVRQAVNVKLTDALGLEKPALNIQMPEQKDEE